MRPLRPLLNSQRPLSLRERLGCSPSDSDSEGTGTSTGFRMGGILVIEGMSQSQLSPSSQGWRPADGAVGAENRDPEGGRVLTDTQEYALWNSQFPPSVV